MPQYLSQEWLDAQRDASAGLPAAPDVSARIQFVIPGGPDGEQRHVTVVDDGRITESSLGTADGDVDLTLTITYPEAVQLLNGELDPNAAFMRGRIKVAGSTGTLLRLLALTKAPAYETARADLAAATDL